MNFLSINITEKMVSPKKTTLERGLGLFLLFVCLVVVVVVVGSWRGRWVILVLLKATICVLKTYPPKLLVVIADEAI